MIQAYTIRTNQDIQADRAELCYFLKKFGRDHDVTKGLVRFYLKHGIKLLND